jgi:hypothetical protein
MRFDPDSCTATMVYTRSMAKQEELTSLDVENHVENHNEKQIKKRKRMEGDARRSDAKETIDIQLTQVLSLPNAKDTWYASNLHARLFKVYVKELLRFGDERQSKENSLRLILNIRRVLNGGERCRVREIVKRVGNCGFCHNIRTLSRIFSFGEEEVACGKNCCARMEQVFEFYTRMRNMFVTEEKRRMALADEILSYLDDSLVQ